jgi:hypothetical protein
MPELLRRLAAKAHNHQLVPFLGAGCALGHVQVDWDGITRVMKERLSGGDGPRSNPEVADLFVNSFGEDAFAALLREHLLVDKFDDAKGTTPLQVLALELRSIYTTNQDNVLECAAQSVGRDMVVVAKLTDLGAVRPGDRVLYKFHGSLDHPETLVFTSEQYRLRMDSPYHFMNVRLRSELLTKSFLFIGYSFRDRNIRELLFEMRTLFAQALPGSFLLAYEWSSELNSLCAEYGVECVDPAAHVKSPSPDPGENLEAFLKQLCEATFELCTEEQLEDLFRPKRPSPVRVAIRHQVEAVSELAFSGALDALAVFRGTCDGCAIPEALQNSVARSFVEIARTARPEQIADLHGALFNLQLPPTVMWEAVSAYLALANRLPKKDLRSLLHMPPGNNWPRELLPLAAARAVELLQEWGEQIGDNFRSRCSHWFDSHWHGLPDAMKLYVAEQISFCWSQRGTMYEHPIRRAERLAKLPGRQLFESRSFQDIHEQLCASFPKRFQTPRES